MRILSVFSHPQFNARWVATGRDCLAWGADGDANLGNPNSTIIASVLFSGAYSRCNLRQYLYCAQQYVRRRRTGQVRIFLPESTLLI